MGKRRPARPLPSTPRTLHGAFPDATVDLHGLHAEPAMRRVENFLRTASRRHPGGVVEIITGKGLGSEGRAVLFDAVREQLTHDLPDLVEDWALARGGGGWIVRLRE